IFNSETRLKNRSGQFGIYRPITSTTDSTYSNPLFASALVSGSNAAILNCLNATNDDLLAVAKFFTAATNLNDLSLSVATLSMLYRHIDLSMRLGISVNAYLELMRLLNKQNEKTLSIDSAIAVHQLVSWMNDWQIHAFDLSYMVTGQMNPYVSAAITDENRIAFLQQLKSELTKTFLNTSIFSGFNLAQAKAQNLLAALVASGYPDTDVILPENVLTDTQLSALTLKDAIGALRQKGYLEKSSLAELLLEKQASEIFSASLYQNLVQLLYIDERGIVLRPILESSTDWIQVAASIELSKNGQPYTLALNFKLDDEQVIWIRENLNARFSEQVNKLDFVFSTTLGVDELLFSALRSGIARFQEHRNDVVFFTNQEFADSQQTKSYLNELSKWVFLAEKFQLTADEVDYILDLQNTIGISGASLTIEAIQNIAQTKWLTEQLNGSVDTPAIRLKSLLGSTALTPDFLTLVDWNSNEFDWLKTNLFPNNSFSAISKNLAFVKKCFDVRAKTNSNFETLRPLSRFPSLAATVENWNTCTETLAAFTNALSLQTNAEQWPAYYKKIIGPVREHQREALVAYALFLLGGEYDEERLLSEFLLIDVSMNSDTEISLIKQALNSVQLYLQRCRLHLEKGVTIDAAEFHESWWEWIMNYRVWEANRKVFLYPENYLDPSLRKNKTSLFQELENELQQGNVDQLLVEKAFTRYMNGFEKLATLQYVDAYSCVVKENEQRFETLFLFARTQNSPYEYYYISRKKPLDSESDAEIWSEWQRIDVAIDAEYITPVFAFNRLFIFWINVKKSDAQDNTTSETNKSSTIWKADINYTFHNFSGDWSSTQTILSDKVINVKTERQFTSPNQNLFYDDLDYWYKVGANVVYRKQVESEVEIQFEEKIVLHYGPFAGSQTSPFVDPLIDFDSGLDDSNNAAQNTIPELNKDIKSFVDTLIDFNQHLYKMRSSNINGFIPVHKMIVMDSSLNASIILDKEEHLLFYEQGRIEEGRSFQVIRDENRLEIRRSPNAIYTNYQENLPNTPNLALSNQKKTILSSINQNTQSKYQVVSAKNSTEKFIYSVDGESYLFETNSSGKISDYLIINTAGIIFSPQPFHFLKIGLTEELGSDFLFIIKNDPFNAFRH
ncbi:MAG: neuraminidase-like domain-containing protein, partial [Bacteroidia bacterium]